MAEEEESQRVSYVDSLKQAWAYCYDLVAVPLCPMLPCLPSYTVDRLIRNRTVPYLAWLASPRYVGSSLARTRTCFWLHQAQLGRAQSDSSAGNGANGAPRGPEHMLAAARSTGGRDAN